MSRTRPATAPALFVWSALGIVYVVWGSTYLAIRTAVAHLPWLGSAGTRFTSAGVLLGLILMIRNGPSALRVRPRQLASAALVGLLLLTVSNALVTLAESPRLGLPSGLAALLIALTPLLMVGLRAVAGDRPRPTTVAGVVVGLAGLAVLFTPGTGTGGGHAVPVLGGLAVIAAVLSWGGGSFATRWLPMPDDPFVASVYEMIFGGVLLFGLAWLHGEPPPWRWPAAPWSAWFSLAYLIVFGSIVAYTAYVWLLHRAPISLVTTYAYVNPVIALGLGVALAGEVLTPQVLVSSAVVLFGVVLVVSSERPSRT